MKKNKARYVSSFKPRYENRYYIQTWEYRGIQYQVECARTWDCAIQNDRGGSESQAAQHRRAQESIDAQLDNPKIDYPEQKYKGSAQEGLDLFFKFVDGEIS